MDEFIEEVLVPPNPYDFDSYEAYEEALKRQADSDRLYEARRKYDDEKADRKTRDELEQERQKSPYDYRITDKDVAERREKDKRESDDQEMLYDS